jgi:hypothetical protein
VGATTKWVGLLLIVGFGAFFGYPLLNEDAASECDALQRIMARIALSADNGNQQVGKLAFGGLGQLFQGASRGDVAPITVKKEYPKVPVSIGCAMVCWREVFYPENFAQVPTAQSPAATAAEAQR